uniref:Uncharacterized protein n=1 Tax=Anguilla anguilla TaxID=7936 RepID=A0A0E9UP96_ANGAN
MKHLLVYRASFLSLLLHSIITHPVMSEFCIT